MGAVRGVNLGGLLDSREGVWPGWELQAKHLSAVAEAGFDCVRLPVRWWEQSSPKFDEAVASVAEQAWARGCAWSSRCTMPTA